MHKVLMQSCLVCSLMHVGRLTLKTLSRILNFFPLKLKFYLFPPHCLKKNLTIYKFTNFKKYLKFMCFHRSRKSYTYGKIVGVTTKAMPDADATADSSLRG